MRVKRTIIRFILRSPMQHPQASKTAEYNALFRAIESTRPATDRLFDDPFAPGFLRPSLRRVAALAFVPWLRPLIVGYIDRRWPGSRPSVIARTRFIDDALLQALRDGIEQIVILGAGFDSRAYRLPGIERARVFELDHPRTLTAKRQYLQQMLGMLPPQVVFGAMDFHQQSLAAVLQSAGFDATRRAFFLWEGVTNYLTAQAVDTTLRCVGAAAPGSQLLFTYIHQGVLDGSRHFVGARQVARLLRRVDEPWTFGLDPAALPAYLAVRGLRLLDDVGSLEYRARYMAPQGRHMRGYAFYRAALAQVIGAPGGHAALAASVEATSTQLPEKETSSRCQR
jgi:methyltransferase (TIGR00027 family)